MSDKHFAILLKCMDFRLQSYSHELNGAFNIRGFDLLSYPGIAKAMVSDQQVYDVMKRAILLSVELRGTNTIILSGHGDCGAYRIPDRNEELAAQLANMNKLKEKLAVDLPGMQVKIAYFIIANDGSIKEIREIL